jgi:putative hydrolase of the HAD superfamily
LIRAVLFDLDGTLHDRKATYRAFMEGQWTRFHDRLTAIPLEGFMEAAIRSDVNGQAPRINAYGALAKSLGLDRELEHELLADYLAGYPAAAMPFPRVDELLDALRGMGMRLGIITNGSIDVQGRKLDTLGFRPRFDAILISEAERVRKPESEIFRRALARLSVDADASVFVGDNPEADVRGAKAAGMRAVWIRDAWFEEPPTEADAVVETVAEVLQLVSRWSAA